MLPLEVHRQCLPCAIALEAAIPVSMANLIPSPEKGLQNPPASPTKTIFPLPSTIIP